MSKTRKGNGQGYTYQVGNSYKTVIRHQGRVISATAKTRAESRKNAKEKLNTSLLIQDEGSSGNEITLGRFLHEWLENEHKHQIAHSTYLRYRSLFNTHINPLLGSYQLIDLSAKILTNFLLDMKRAGQSARSQQQARALLSIALRVAEELELIPSNPVRNVRNPQNRTAQINPLTIEEVRRLLGTYEGTYMAARLHIALICGLRQGEALGLTWSDVDWAQKFLSIERQIQTIDRQRVFTGLKTHRSRRKIVLTEETLRVLKTHEYLIYSRQAAGNENISDLNLVFPGKDGLPRSAMSDYDEWQKALKLCGIPPRKLHDARHTSATLMYSQGVGIETISRCLGHSSSAITSRLYVHSSEEPLRKAAVAMSGLLFSC